MAQSSFKMAQIRCKQANVAQDRLKMLESGSNGSKWPKTASKWIKSGPKTNMAQNSLKMAQMRSKTGQNGQKTGSEVAGSVDGWRD